MPVSPLAGATAEHDGPVLAACVARAALEAAPPRPPITDLAIPACGKPALLARSVRSWTAFARRHGRRLDFTVVDDSPDAGRAAAQRDAAAALAAELGVSLRCTGPAERAAFAARLARAAGVDAAVATFAVDGRPAPRVGIGGSRNLVNLLLPGRRVLSADDDVIAAFEAPPRHALALWISAEEVPMHTWFFESPAETGARVPMDDAPDALGLHEDYLGSTVAAVAARLSGPASLRGAGALLTEAIRQRPVRIAATALGLAGDAASDCLGFLALVSGGDTEQRMVARAPLPPSREILRRPEFPVLCQGVYLMTFCHAVDNALPLPPYFPVDRGEDQTWQRLLHWTLPDTVVAHLPLAVRHRPDGERRYGPADYQDPCARFPANAFLLGLLGVPAPPAAASPDADPDARLAAMARHLADAAGSAPRFRALAEGAWRAYLLHHRSLVATALGTRAGYPAWWHETLTAVQAGLDRRLAAPADVPLDYAGRVGPDALEAQRQDVLRYAALLEAWPALRAAAAGLGGEGA